MVSFGGLFFFLWVCKGLLLVVSTPCANADHVLEDACNDAEQSSSFVQMRATSGLKQHQAACDACFAKFDTPAVNGCKVFNMPGIGQKIAVKMLSKLCPNSKECEAQLASRCSQGPEPTAAPPTVPPMAVPIIEPPAPPTEAPTAAPTIAIQRAILPGPTPVPAPTAPPPPPANAHPDSYPVFPVNCSVHGKPIQMAKTDGGFSAHQLDIETGGYKPIFDVKWTDMKGMFSDLNACGINPFDDIIYCIMNAALKSYIVRLSPGRIAFVATLRPETYNTGGFGPKGRYYVATHVGKFTVINNVHGMIGYKDQFDTGIPSLSKLPMLQPAGWYNTADVVVVTQDFDGTGAEDYLMSLTGKRLQIAKWDGTKFSGSWIIPTATGNWKADTWGENYGAGWSFEGKCFFAANSGAGVYQIPLDKIDINSKTPISLSRVGSSEFGEDSDGLNCMSQPDPWITNVRPFDCKVHRDAPIQIMKGSFGYGVKKLSLTTGELTDLYSIPYTYTNPPFENLNAAGINPLDKIVYGCMLMAEAPGPMYIVRFDSTRVEFVAKLQGSFDPIGGTFDTNGRFYFISYPETNFKGYIMAVDGLDQMKGYNMPNATGITDITKDTLSIQLGETMQIADIVTISYPDKENKSVDHVIGVNRDQELVVINWKGAQTKVHELNTNNVLEKVGGDHGSKLNWGAAWNYEGRLIFASNDGVGVFEAKEFKDNIGYLILEKVVPSNTVWDTDGFNCPLSSPFMGYEQNPVIAKMIQYNW